MESAHERFLFTCYNASKSSLVAALARSFFFFDASALVNKNRSCAISMEQSLFISWMAFRVFVICIRRSQSSVIIPFAFVEYEIVKRRREAWP